MELATDHPFSPMTRQMSRAMEQMQRGYYNFCPSETWNPAVNLYESEENYLVCVDLAGVDKEKIDVEVVEQTLTIKGTREVPVSPDGEEKTGKLRVHLMEIDHGSFCRQVELPPDVSRDQIKAT